MKETTFWLFDQCTEPIYFVFTLSTLSAVVSPFLKQLARHGKTRAEDVATQTRTCRSGSLNKLSNIVLNSKWMLVPKSWFSHFYVLGLIAFVIWRWMSLSTAKSVSKLDLMLLIHLSRRFLECMIVHQWRRESKMHLAGYLVGIAHYVWLPLVYFPYEMLENARSDVQVPIDLLHRHNPMEILSCFFCMWSQYQQNRHHRLLANVRRQDKVVRFGLPRGGWFGHLSCPHYFCEILLYVSFGIIRWNEECEYASHRRIWIVLAWVITNLSISGIESHSWYERNFKGYAESSRYAVIPLIL